jgi:hypothetical protein
VCAHLRAFVCVCVMCVCVRACVCVREYYDDVCVCVRVRVCDDRGVHLWVRICVRLCV